MLIYYQVTTRSSAQHARATRHGQRDHRCILLGYYGENSRPPTGRLPPAEAVACATFDPTPHHLIITCPVSIADVTTPIPDAIPVRKTLGVPCVISSTNQTLPPSIRWPGIGGTRRVFDRGTVVSEYLFVLQRDGAVAVCVLGDIGGGGTTPERV